MSVEELGRVADAARDFIYSQWEYYLHVKTTGGAQSSHRLYLAVGRAVEECYGSKPKTWEEDER